MRSSKMGVMVITVLPGAGIKCQAGEFSLLVDPPSGKRGDLILETEVSLPIDSFSSPELIQGAGEYELSGIKVNGISVDQEDNKESIKTAYKAELDGIKMGFLGEVSSMPKESVLDNLSSVDILFFSADTKKLKAKQITLLIKQIDPKVIIPTADKIVRVLSEEMGQKVKAEEKLVIKKKDLVKDDKAYSLVWLKTKQKTKV